MMSIIDFNTKLHSVAGLELDLTPKIPLYVDRALARLREAARSLLKYLQTPRVHALPAAIDAVSLQWVEEMYLSVFHNDIEAASDLLFERIDDLLLDGRMDEVDNIIRTIDLARLESYLLVGLLSITFAAKDHLHSRENLVQRIETRFKQSDPTRVEVLMAGLR